MSVNQASKKRVLIAGAEAYAQAFGRVPSAGRDDIEAEMEDQPTEIRNAVIAALWAYSYEAFVDAVRRALVKAV